MATALYRKYRPSNFSEVKGQEHIVSVLEKEVKTGKVSHAYLFCGGRGTGKTSIARIFAKTLGVNDEDIYEMDAASNRGIDEIRAIRDSVHTYPYSSKYKIYIVDEVHMLTKDAWNAFLKTLEEPPSHVIFIMATTEKHKVLDTVISRCEVFQFKKPSHSILVDSLMGVTKEEGKKLEKKSASLIATLADGSFRDALSILQKVINVSEDTEIPYQKVEEVLGAPKESHILDIIEGVAEKDAERAMKGVHAASKENSDMQVFLKMILRSLRFVLLLRFSPDLKEAVVNETGEEEYERLVKIAKTGKNINSKTIVAFLDAIAREPSSSIPELPIELAIVESCGQNE